VERHYHDVFLKFENLPAVRMLYTWGGCEQPPDFSCGKRVRAPRREVLEAGSPADPSCWTRRTCYSSWS